MNQRINLGIAGLCSLVWCAACNPGANNILGGLGGTGGSTTTNPVAAFIPDAITLETGELPMDDSGAAKSINQDLVSATTLGYRRTLYTAANIVHGFHFFADRALALAARVRLDMTSRDQTQVEGKFIVNGASVAYRADFAAFDFDGDGKADGSGNAVDLPVAVRIWTDTGSGFQRFMCALITMKPSKDNLGAGATYVKPSAANTDAYADLQMFVTWDRTDPMHKWNDAILTGQVGPLYRVSPCRARVDVRTNAADAVEKTARGTATLTDNPWGFTTIATATHWQQLGTIALISAQTTGGAAQIDFSDICLDLSQRSVAANGACDAFDTQDMDFLAAPAASDADFPTDFPSTPTFGSASAAN